MVQQHPVSILMSKWQIFKGIHIVILRNFFHIHSAQLMSATCYGVDPPSSIAWTILDNFWNRNTVQATNANH
ncbi:hypothetical protein AVR78_22955 [Klebsiella quasipneumoniae]|nr:hypothetical protein AVR78_22955 [Klebsiella quasipneumoniae]